MPTPEENELTAGQGLPAPDCCALADALALVEFGPCRDAARPQDWMSVAAPMCAHCQGSEDVNFAAARIIAVEYKALAANVLAWTSEKPTRIGYYWWDPQGPLAIGKTSYGGACEIVRVESQGWDGKLYIDQDEPYGENPLIEEIPGKWAGPITLPSHNK
jgi:hypothetical protein